MAIGEALTACLPPFMRRRVSESVANYGWFSSWALNLLQINDRNMNPDGTSKVPGLKRYVDMARQWAATRSQIMGEAEQRVNEIQRLSKDRRDKMFEVLYEEQLEEDSSFRGYTDQQLRTKGFDDEMLAVRHGIKEDFGRMLDRMQAIAELDIRRRYRSFEEESQRQRALAEIRRDFEMLRRRPYFPLMRFGKYSITVYDDQGKVRDFELYDTQRERDARVRAIQGSVAREGLKVHAGLMPDQYFSFQGLPSRFRDMLISNLNLNETQRGQLNDILNKLAPEQSFRKQLMRRRRTAGFAHDGMRTYANYFFHGANHLSRVEWTTPMEEAIEEVRRQRHSLPGPVADATQLDGIANYLEKHLDYILNPKNELAGLRAWGFLWYLGFMPKSALVNLTQVPLVTLPYLGARYGDGAATEVLPGAIRDAIWNPARDKLPRHEVEMLEHLTELGLVDQSFATELAALSGGTKLSILTADSKEAQSFRSLIGKGAWIFAMAEKANRRATALAAYRLHREKLLGGRKIEALTPAEQASMEYHSREAAREAVERTQFEYSSWNRPPFMRGKKSVIFMFMQYVQNMLYFTARDPGNSRYLLLMLFFAGLQGLPFAEDILDLIDQMGSTPNKRFNVRKEAREFLLEMGLNPDYMMMGLGVESFGLSWLGDKVGIPFPAFDVSGSLSMGRPLGFTEPLVRVGGFSNRNLFGSVTEAAGGAAVAIPANIIRAATSDNPNLWKRVELAMPSFPKSVSRALRYYYQGEETTLSGAFLADLEVSSVKDAGELLLQGVGFAPTAVTRARRAVAAAKEVEIYYETRRRALLGSLNYAYQSGGREEAREALGEITRYNRDVPYPELRIKRSSIERSRKAFLKRRRAQETGRAPEEIFVRLSQETRGPYEGF